MKVYLGIDWSSQKHDYAILNEKGGVILQDECPHTQDGLMQIEMSRWKVGVSAGECLVGIETAHSLVIDFLWAWGYQQVYVLPPKTVNRARDRYRQSGAQDDPGDAQLIADLLRTELHRFYPWHPDSELTQTLRVQVGLAWKLTQQIVRQSNQLHSYLLRYHPAADQAFGIDSLIQQAFLRAYPTPQAVAELTWEAFQSFARQHHYPKPKTLPASFARIKAAYPLADPVTVSAYQDAALTLSACLEHTLQTRTRVLAGVQKLFHQHPDYPVFSSLPGAGEILAPALLAKFGDDRRRFPHPGVVQSFAGTCPVTERSGKRIHVFFRQACDHEFRTLAQQWARASIRESAWANTYFQLVRPHCQSTSHAYRCLANRWLAILWKLWQTGVPFDEAYHLRKRAARLSPRTLSIV